MVNRISGQRQTVLEVLGGGSRIVYALADFQVIMDEMYLLSCTRYVELNPVRAGLVKKPEDWRWSIADPHMKGQDDILVKTKPLLEIVDTPWRDFLGSDVLEPQIELFQKHVYNPLPTAY
jgi:putative transposase